jgi:hypothetical protein
MEQEEREWSAARCSAAHLRLRAQHHRNTTSAHDGTRTVVCVWNKMYVELPGDGATPRVVHLAFSKGKGGARRKQNKNGCSQPRETAYIHVGELKAVVHNTAACRCVR